MLLFFPPFSLYFPCLFTISMWCIHLCSIIHLILPNLVKSISIRNWSWRFTISCLWWSTYHLIVSDKCSFSAALYSFFFRCFISFYSCHSESMIVSHIRHCRMLIYLSEREAPTFSITVIHPSAKKPRSIKSMPIFCCCLIASLISKSYDLFP